MVGSYRIEDVEIYQEEVFMRAASVSVRGKEQKSIGRAVDKSIDKIVYNNFLPSLGGYINENYINIDLKTLRLIDSDDDKRESYIKDKTKFLDKNLLNVFFIKLIYNEQDKILDSDIEYLNYMLAWERNDIYVMPIIEFDGNIDRPTRVTTYSDFTRRMLEFKNRMVKGTLNIGISVPAYFSRRQLPDLFNLYKDENTGPTFTVLDFANARLSDPKRLGVARATMNYFDNINEEKYFIYGLSVKPYKRGESLPAAEDMHLAESGFNAFGGPHNKIRRFIPPPQNWNQLAKVFGRNDYYYHGLGDDATRESFSDWSSENYNIDTQKDFQLVAPMAGQVARVIKRFNFCQLNTELKELTDAIRKSDNDLIKERMNGKPLPPSTI